MGSFNTTCFASNQTIAPGDKVRIMALIQRSTYNPIEVRLRERNEKLFGIANSICYPDSFWAPLTGFLPAVYDDYGQCELVLDTAQQRTRLLEFLVWLLRHGAKSEAGENTSHDIEVDLPAYLAENAPGVAAVLQLGRNLWHDKVLGAGEDLSAELADVWKFLTTAAVLESRLFAETYSSVLRPVSFAIMHEASYERLVAMMNEQTSWSGESYEMEAFIRRGVASALERTEEAAKKANATEAALREKLGDNFSPKDLQTARGILEFMFIDFLSEHLRRAGGSSDSLTSARIDLQAAVRGHSGALMAGEVSPQFIEATKPALCDLYAYGGLEALNLRLSPMVYAGQDYDNGIGQAYATFVQCVSTVVTEGRRVAAGED